MLYVIGFRGTEKYLIHQVVNTTISFTIDILHLDILIFHKSKLNNHNQIGISIDKNHHLLRTLFRIWTARALSISKITWHESRLQANVRPSNAPPQLNLKDEASTKVPKMPLKPLTIANSSNHTSTSNLSAPTENLVHVDLDPILGWWCPIDELFLFSGVMGRYGRLNSRGLQGILNHPKNLVFQFI